MRRNSYANGTERTNEAYDKAVACFMEHYDTFVKHGVKTIWRLNPNLDNWHNVDHKEIERFTLDGYEWVIVDVYQYSPSDGYQLKRECLYQPTV